MQIEEHHNREAESADAERDPELPPRRATYKKMWDPRTRPLLSNVEQKSLELRDVTQVQRIKKKPTKKQSHEQSHARFENLCGCRAFVMCTATKQS